LATAKTASNSFGAFLKAVPVFTFRILPQGVAPRPVPISAVLSPVFVFIYNKVPRHPVKTASQNPSDYLQIYYIVLLKRKQKIIFFDSPKNLAKSPKY
jgi:hypothetical protein